MSEFFNDTMRSLTQATEIEKGNIPLTERKGMTAPTYYVAENNRKGSNTMPFVKIDIKKEIQRQREIDPEFRDAWDNHRDEYRRLAGKEYKRELRRERKRRRERMEINKRLK